MIAPESVLAWRENAQTEHSERALSKTLSLDRGFDQIQS